jgi:hypothetical protein
MRQISKYSVGLRYGLIGGVLYAVLLFCRFKYFSSNPTSYYSFTETSYLIILITLFLAGMARKKELGGFAEMREIFQSIFIAILLLELVYVLFVFIYMKFTDPGFISHFRASSLAYFHQKQLTDKDIDERIKGIESITEETKPSGLVIGFGTAVVVDSVFGFIFAAILRRKKPIQAETKL